MYRSVKLSVFSTVSVVLWIINTGCSFKKPSDGTKINVHLVKTKTTHVFRSKTSSKPSAKRISQQTLRTSQKTPVARQRNTRGSDKISIALASSSTPPPANQVTTIDDIGCVTINIRGGLIPTQSMCDGGAEIGVSPTPQLGLNNTFEPIIPIDDGLVFEAFGTADGSCPNVNGEGSGDPNSTVFRLGTTVVNMASHPVTNVVIPLSLDTTDSFNCSREPFVVFYDPLDYSSGVAANLSSINPDIWAPDSSATMSELQVLPAGVQMDAGVQGENFLTESVLPALFTRLQITMDATNFTTATGTGVIALGLSDGRDHLAPSNVLGCQLVMDDTGLLDTFGDFSSLSSIISPGIPSVGPMATFVTYFLCDITRAPGSFDIYSGLIDDLDNVEVGTPYFNGSDPCPNCTIPYVHVDSSALGGTDNILITDFLIEQSDVP